MSQAKILILVGPTGSGKTDVAVEISKRVPSEMISCDSMQVYRSMPILSQAPSKQTTRVLKTHLVSFMSPDKEYSVALFRSQAESLISKILAKGKTPMVVGGTGLYLRALLDGLFEAGSANLLRDERLREKLFEEEARRGPGFLHNRLKKVDPASAQKIHPNDLRRVVRALEVFILTKKPLSSQKQNKKGIRDQYDCRIFLLDRDRADLYERVNRRVERMMTEGLEAQVKRLLRRKLSKTAAMALGIREIKSYIEGKCSREQAVELLKKNTRNYAKRQLSWFRHERGAEVIPVAAEDTPNAIASKVLHQFLKG